MSAIQNVPDLPSAADFPFDSVGFDLDGTLIDSFRDLGTAVNHALTHGGFDAVAVETAKDLIGGGAKIMLARAVEAQGGIDGGIEGETFRALYKEMLAYYADHNAVHSTPYPHAREILAELSGRGVKLAIVTNKFSGFATSILTQLDLIDPFEVVIGGDSMGKGPDGRFLSKPHPDPVIEARARLGNGRFAFIGDSTYDIKAARGAGVPVVAAAYGYCDMPPHDLGADAVIQSLDEFIPALERLGNKQ